MRIILDFRIFGPECGGLGRYNQKLLENLVKIDQENEYIILRRDFSPKINLPKNFRIKIVNIKWYSLSEQILLPLLIYSLKPDLVHFPHFNVPMLYRGKYVITIHDLIVSHFPSIKASTLGRFTFYIKRWAYNLTIKNAIHKADKIIAVSKFTKQDIVEYFKLSTKQAEKIKVIYEGISFKDANQNLEIKLPANFFLYVGVAYPHKNLEFLVDAFAEYLKYYPDYFLILIGKRNYFYARLEQYIKQNYKNIVDKIIYKGFVPDLELSAYYKQASAFIFPSLYEGFGLPPLESMQHGTVVVSSRSSCLPEVLGEAALYFDPTNKQDLVNKLEIITKNTELKNNLIAKGQVLVTKYSWTEMTKQIMKIYSNE
jgi:glycosyltransferase involved in cell wall biosynthesis